MLTVLKASHEAGRAVQILPRLSRSCSVPSQVPSTVDLHVLGISLDDPTKLARLSKSSQNTSIGRRASPSLAH